MDFTTIGTLHSYVQQKNLKFAADYKKKTGQSVVSSTGNLKLDLKAANNKSLVDKMIQAQQSNKDEYSKQRISSIKQKLMNGKKISNEELGYLKKNDPDLYKKAKKAEEAREDLKAALRKAKTKQEARQAVTQALIKASAEATAELAAAKNAGVGGAGLSGGNTPSYEASQEIGGPSAEAIFGGNNIGDSNNEPSMIRLNEQINASSSENDVNVEEIAAQEGATLNKINNEVNIAREVRAEAAKAESANSTESINNKPDSVDSSKSNNTNNPLDTNNNGSPVSGIMEKFIMVVRAIEDEWINFTKSDDYKELAEDLFEEAEIELSGKHKRKNKNLISKPDQKVIDMISAYRNSMEIGNNKELNF